MTKEEKQLLLKDLCARLPYGVILSVTLKDKYDEIVTRDIQLSDGNLTYITSPSHWREYKPYLRPMPSMTEEEKMEHITLTNYNKDYSGKPYRELTIDSIDWLNEHHFDYRELIVKGLALEAPDGMY